VKVFVKALRLDLSEVVGTTREVKSDFVATNRRGGGKGREMTQASRGAAGGTQRAGARASRSTRPQIEANGGLGRHSAVIAGGVAGAVIVYAALSGPPQPTRRYIYDTPSPLLEAAYCLAVAQRVGEITHGVGAVKLEWYLREQTSYWQARALRGGAPEAGDTPPAQGAAPPADLAAALAQGRARLVADSSARGVNEQAHLHLALQRCGERSLAQGARLRSME
jgi:hypothetical protein